LILRRPTGGKVEMLATSVAADHLVVLADRRLHVGEELSLPSGKAVLTVEASLGRGWRVAPLGVSLAHLLATHGKTPLPPYMKDSPLTEPERRAKYQSVFAKVPGSIAAPTASLHFTKRLIAKLKRQGISFVDVTLHVNLGTFAPLTDEQWRTGKLHHEHFVLPPKTIAALQKAKKSGRPIIPIGTTALRALESAADEQGSTFRAHGVTDLFIREGYRFKVVDGLLTNFHVPKSSLLMLVGALVGRETVMALYAKAVAKGLRLFSFGDAMLILCCPSGSRCSSQRHGPYRTDTSRGGRA
jgi:S-adenosylmethionine:tRNA ribosyltransferase-isomerase